MLDIKIDVKHAEIEFKVASNALSGPISKDILTDVGHTMIAYLRKRFREGGFGTWPNLQKKTVDIKKAIKAPKPEAILREWGSLYDGLEKKISAQRSPILTVGYLTDRRHRSKHRKKPTQYDTARKLVTLHAQGAKHLKQRPVIAALMINREVFADTQLMVQIKRSFQAATKKYLPR